MLFDFVEDCLHEFRGALLVFEDFEEAQSLDLITSDLRQLVVFDNVSKFA